MKYTISSWIAVIFLIADQIFYTIQGEKLYSLVCMIGAFVILGIINIIHAIRSLKTP